MDNQPIRNNRLMARVLAGAVAALLFAGATPSASAITIAPGGEEDPCKGLDPGTLIFVVGADGSLWPYICYGTMSGIGTVAAEVNNATGGSFGMDPASGAGTAKFLVAHARSEAWEAAGVTAEGTINVYLRVITDGVSSYEVTRAPGRKVTALGDDTYLFHFPAAKNHASLDVTFVSAPDADRSTVALQVLPDQAAKGAPEYTVRWTSATSAITYDTATGEGVATYVDVPLPSIPTDATVRPATSDAGGIYGKGGELPQAKRTAAARNA